MDQVAAALAASGNGTAPPPGAPDDRVRREPLRQAQRLTVDQAAQRLTVPPQLQGLPGATNPAPVAQQQPVQQGAAPAQPAPQPDPAAQLQPGQEAGQPAQDQPADAALLDNTQAIPIADDAVVALPDGTNVTGRELNEWRAGYLRRADYERKNQERNASLRQTQSYLEDSQRYTNYVKSVYEAILPKVDPALAATDPAAYVQADAQRRQVEAILTDLQAGMQIEEQRRLELIQGEELEKLHQLKPEWRDPNKARADGEEMIRFAMGKGATDRTVKAVRNDAFLLWAVSEAMRHQAVRAGGQAGGQASAQARQQQQQNVVAPAPSPTAASGVRVPQRPEQVQGVQSADFRNRVRGERSFNRRMDLIAGSMRPPA